jgi:hypothetical protein
MTLNPINQSINSGWTQAGAIAGPDALHQAGPHAFNQPATCIARRMQAGDDNIELT